MNDQIKNTKRYRMDTGYRDIQAYRHKCNLKVYIINIVYNIVLFKYYSICTYIILFSRINNRDVLNGGNTLLKTD